MKHLKVNDTDSNEDLLMLDGYIALYGGDDLSGERFTAETDFESSYTRNNSVLVDWEHGLKPDRKNGTPIPQPGEDDVFGKIDYLTARADDIGLLARHVLNRRERYVREFVEPLARAGLLGSSSAATPEGVTKSGDGTITKWPLKRQALTVMPMETRLLTDHQLQVVKSLADDYPELKSLIGAQESTSGDEPGATPEDTETVLGDNNMTDEIQNEVDLTAIEDALKAVNERLDGMGLEEIKTTLGKVVATLEKTPAPRKAGTIEVIEDEEDKPQFKSMGEFLQALASDPRDRRLRSARSEETGLGGYFDMEKAIGKKAVGTLYDRKQQHLKAAPTGLGGSSQPAIGGFLVGTDQQSGLLARTYDVGRLLQSVDMMPISANSNGMTVNAEEETSRATGSRRGGIRGYWLAENSAITASNPTFRQMELKLQKLGALAYATDELLADASALEAWIMNNVPEELAFLADDAIVRGTGAGQPLGILNSGCLVSVAAETGQAAATVVAENISKMWARRWVSGRNYVWLINQDVEPELDNLNLPVGTGGSLVYMPAGGLSGAPYGSIKGRPVIPVEYASTLGTVGDIMLVDLNEYQMIEKGGIQSASSIHVRFTQDEQVFRFIMRLDGQPKWNAALTPYQGTNTVSPFVALASRA